MALQSITRALPAPESFSYERLPESDSIRVLSLRAFDDQRPSAVHCTLFVRTVASNDSQGSTYKALSYVWGEVDDLETIQVNNLHVRVRSNLYHALLELSKDNAGFPLWVDALCIDQANLKERSVQVALMGDIYSNATQVIVWLGDGLEPDGTMGTTLPHGFTQYAESGAELLTSSALQCFAQNHWFQRCWTMQELILARDAIVRCGPHEIAWSKLSALSEMAAEGERTDGSYDPDDLSWTTWFSTDNVLRIQNLLVQFTKDELKLSQLLEESWRRLTSEPVDLVFAVMGLFPRPPITIDYSQPPRKVCKEVTVACILRERTLRILELACLINSDDTDPSADPFSALTDEQLLDPSRGPSWAISIPTRRVFAHTAPLEMPLQSISDETLARVRSEPALCVLPLTGSVLGRFTGVGNPSKGEDLEAMPVCTTLAEFQTSITTPTPGLFSKLLHSLERHDKHLCPCPSTPPLPRLNLDSSVRISARKGDYISLLDGGDLFYQLRLVAGHLKLVGTVSSQREDVMDKILGSGWRAGATQGWPRVRTDIPLA